MVVLDWISQVLAAVRDVWAFRAPASLLTDPESTLPIALGVALLAGLSTMVGHVVVFSINRVGGWRLAAGITLGAVFTALLRILTAGTIAVAAWVVTGDRIGAETIAITYLFALAPLVLSFLVFVPHVGLVLGKVLEGWALLCLAALLAPVLGIGLWPALAIAAGAWLVSQVLSRLLSRPIAAMTSRAWSLMTGRATFLTAHDILTGAPFVPLQRQEQRA